MNTAGYISRHGLKIDWQNKRDTSRVLFNPRDARHLQLKVLTLQDSAEEDSLRQMTLKQPRQRKNHMSFRSKSHVDAN